MPIHIIPTRISTAGKTLNSIIPINPTNYADLPLGCVCEGTEVRNSADENVKIYNIKHSHQPI